jgi:sugar O-acyltransferase (sialic acid O-acetyltransferase NeuD family)
MSEGSMPEQLIIIGAATPTIIRVVDDLNQFEGERFRIVGFLDNAFAKLGSHYRGFEVLGGFETIERYDADRVVLINTIAGSVAKRIDTTEYFLARGYHFTNIIHPKVNMKYVKIGVGNLIYENALIHPFVEIGNHCVISSNSGIAHDSSIGNYCFIGPASYICGLVHVADNVFIGAGATILPRLQIDKGASIGAGSLVNKSVSGGRRVVNVAPGPR